MKKYINKQYIFGRARLFIVTAFLLLISNSVFAQALSCSSYAAIPANSIFSLNGITVTISYSGSSLLYGTSSPTMCSGENVNGSVIYAGGYPGGTGSTASGPFSVTLTFSAPVNNLVLGFSGGGDINNPTGVENFIFNSNGGAVSIASPLHSNCAATISGNQIFLRSNMVFGQGGGGLFKITSPSNFTSLTFNGNGGQYGTLIGFCSSSIVAAVDPPVISSITPTTQSVCQNTVPSTITVSATGTGTLSYQWYSNTTGSTTTGTAIPGATSSGYTPPPSSTVGTTYYAAVVTNAGGNTTSPLAKVNVTARPATPVTSAASLLNVCPATTADLTSLQPAAVSGQIYEWHTSVSNPNAGTLVASPNTVSVGGVYYLYSKVTSGGCYSAASNAVTVTINSCATCGSSGNNFVNLNSRFSGTIPNPSVQLQWWKTANRTPGTQEMNPMNVTVSGTYYAFFYDTTNTCWNTTNSTSAVTVNILPLCSCTKPGDFSSAGSITKIGITVQQKQSGWPENVPNGFMALESKEKGFVITRVQNSGAIADPKTGMLIYDKDANCVKLYNGSSWKCISKSCNTP